MKKAARKRLASPPNVETLVAETQAEMSEAWLPRLYRERILTLRTRSHDLPPPSKNAPPEIQHTLLGVELKVGRRRILCPDLATARYLAVFARAGVRSVAVPYDITRISRLADELDSAWHRTLLTLEQKIFERPARLHARARKLLIEQIAREIHEAGAGARIPQFNQNTKQRNSDK